MIDLPEQPITPHPARKHAIPPSVSVCCSVEAIEALCKLILPKLKHRRQSLERENCDLARIEFVTPLSVNNSGCAQDCSFCPHTARYGTSAQAGDFLTTTHAIFYAHKLLTTGRTDNKANDIPLRRLSMQRYVPQKH